MTRRNIRDILGTLTLAASMILAASVQASELTLPGEPEIDQKVEAVCDQAALPDEPLARGRIVAVDLKAGRVTLDFQPILPLLPEGGRRIFQVSDAKSLKGLGPGDKVRFEVERDGRSYTVTRIENSN
jgi:Cu/Ag efflux protein CusF